MKYLSSLVNRVVALAILACTIAIGISLWHSFATNPNRADHRKQYIARVRNGLSEIRFARDGSSHGEVRASAESLARFMRKRSGVDLSQATIAKLTAMEERVLNGEAHRISGSDVSAILRDVAYERVAALTDQDIARAVETLRGFDAPDLPEEYRRGRNIIYIRADRGGPKVNEKVVAQLKTFRDQARSGDGTFKYLLGSYTGREVDSRARLFNEATSEQFAGSSDSANPFDVKLTPAQALLVAYSVLSDDRLLDAEVEHQKHLKLMRDFRAKHSGGYYPDPKGHFAYGVNGYLYSSPLDIFMGEQATDRFLQLVEERSTR
jgi:hypothetical protein